MLAEEKVKLSREGKASGRAVVDDAMGKHEAEAADRPKRLEHVAVRVIWVAWRGSLAPFWGGLAADEAPKPDWVASQPDAMLRGRRTK